MLHCYTPWKQQKTFRFYNTFRWCGDATLGWNWLVFPELLISQHIHFCCCVVISNKKVFLRRVQLISLLGHVRQLQLITTRYDAVCNKWDHISYNNITRYYYRKLQNDETPWYFKIYRREAMSFSNLTDH